jgi:hypothetical protein
MKEATDRFLGQLEAFADGLRQVEPNANKVWAYADVLEKMVREFRMETAPTKQCLQPVRLPGEDAYEVTCE